MKAHPIIGLFASTLFCATANAAIISSNDITGDDPGLEELYTTGLYVNDHITASGIGRVGLTGRAGNDRYNASGWSAGGLNITDDYFWFRLEPVDGYLMSLDYFSFTGDRSATGPTAFAFRSSINSFGENIFEWTSTSTEETEITINLSSTDFQNLANPIDFRLYGYSASGGTFSVNDYEFGGSVTAMATPEPQTLALLGVGSLLLMLHRRRMSRRLQKA